MWFSGLPTTRNTHTLELRTFHPFTHEIEKLTAGLLYRYGGAHTTTTNTVVFVLSYSLIHILTLSSTTHQHTTHRAHTEVQIPLARTTDTKKNQRRDRDHHLPLCHPHPLHHHPMAHTPKGGGWGDTSP